MDGKDPMVTAVEEAAAQEAALRQPAPPREKRCETCRFWQRHEWSNYLSGECHRYAPRPGSGWGWPHTNGENWCGEHEKERSIRDINFQV